MRQDVECLDERPKNGPLDGEKNLEGMSGVLRRDEEDRQWQRG